MNIHTVFQNPGSPSTKSYGHGSMFSFGNSLAVEPHGPLQEKAVLLTEFRANLIEGITK